jgi:hypothetical protein
MNKCIANTSVTSRGGKRSVAAWEMSWMNYYGICKCVASVQGPEANQGPNSGTFVPFSSALFAWILPEPWERSGMTWLESAGRKSTLKPYRVCWGYKENGEDM